MTTTYGTIPPTADHHQPHHRHLISHTTTQIQSHLATRRPWPELFSLTSLSFPPSLTTATSRATANLPYFRTNYTILILITLFLSLITHPVSLIVFIAMITAWILLYFFRDAPLVVFGRVVDDNVVLVVLGVVTVLFLLLTDVTVNIVVGVAVGVVVVLIHSGVREVEDGEFGDERGGVRGGVGERMPLKDAASSGYSA